MEKWCGKVVYWVILAMQCILRSFKNEYEKRNMSVFNVSKYSRENHTFRKMFCHMMGNITPWMGHQDVNKELNLVFA